MNKREAFIAEWEALLKKYNAEFDMEDVSTNSTYYTYEVPMITLWPRDDGNPLDTFERIELTWCAAWDTPLPDESGE